MGHCPNPPRRTDNGGLQVDEDGTRHVLAGASLAEEGVEGVVAAADGLVGGHLTVGLDAVLQTVQLPTGIAHLDSGLPHVDGKTFTLDRQREREMRSKLNRTFCQSCERIIIVIYALYRPCALYRGQELCEIRGGRSPYSPCGLCGRKATLNLSLSKLRSCVKVEVAASWAPRP